jgi:glycerol uptake facilitator protein
MKSVKGELIAEFIGSFILIFIGAGCVAALVLNGAQYNIWDVSVIWGLAVSMALYITAAISGAHINPAVTLALAVYRGFPWAKVLPYATAQTAGTFTASAAVYGCTAMGSFSMKRQRELPGGAQKAKLWPVFSLPILHPT